MFDDLEQLNAEELNRRFPSELGCQLVLLGVLDEYLNKSSASVKTDNSLQCTILGLMGQNLLLLNSSYLLFTQGYLRNSAILLRTVSEQLILGMFFCENPEKEEEYRITPHQEFFRTNKIKKMLKQIDDNGKIFKIENFKEFKFWNRHIFENLFEEMSHFSHVDMRVINSLMLDPKTGKFHKVPWVHEDKILLKIFLRKIMICTIFSILVLDKFFAPEQSPEHIKTIEDATKYINESLNPQADCL